MEFIAAPEKVVVDQSSWLGNMGSFGLSLVLFFGACYMAKNNLIIWGPMFGKLVDRVFTFKKGTPEEFEFDWKSLLSFLLGFWGVTALFGSTGPIADFVVGNFTDFLDWIGGTDIGASVGMGVACFFVTLFTVKKAMKEKGDNISDIKMGAICAAFYPFGGGAFLWFSSLMANGLTEALGGIPVSG